MQTPNQKKPIVVVVDGIIGAGKTSYLEVLEKDLLEYGLRVRIVREPVEKWKECGILKRFYDNPSRWAYHFQAKAFHDRITENINAYAQHKDDTDIFILERSCFTDNLFMEMLYENNTIDALELQHYREWWSLWASIMPYMPDLFIYLKPDVDVCMERLHKRNRPGEENIPKDYQLALQKKHDSFFANDYIDLGLYVNNIDKPSKRAKVVRLITNKDFKNDSDARKEVVLEFMGLFNQLLV